MKTTKMQQLNQKAQELAQNISDVRKVMVLRGWYRPTVHSESIFGYYLNVEYSHEAADYALGRSAAEAEQTLKEHFALETVWRGSLDAIMTVAEVAETYGLTRDAVNKACQRDGIPYRRSGNTLLIRRADAEAKWGKRNLKKYGEQ